MTPMRRCCRWPRCADRLGMLDPDRLITLLADPEPAVRIAASISLPTGGTNIVGLLDDEPAVVEMAAWACGERDSDLDPHIPTRSLATGRRSARAGGRCRSDRCDR